MIKFRTFSIVFCFLLIFSTVGCAAKRPVIEPADGWYAVWLSKPEAAELENIPQSPTLRGSTCRQQIMPAFGGDKLRLTFSNELCESALTIDSVHIAKLLTAGDPAIAPETDVAVTFNGKQSVTVPAGKTVTSDEIAFSFSASELIAVSTKFSDSVPAYPTCHRRSGCTAWVIDGDHTADETFEIMSLMSSTYFLCRVDTWAAAGTETLVVCGDFISDYSGYNGFNGWSEVLSGLLKKNAQTANISVVNSSSGENSVQSTLENIDELLKTPGVHGVVLQLGCNDISLAQSDTSSGIIEKLKKITQKCHEKGVSVYAGTITPFEGSTVYYSELHEKIRNSVNTFITNPNSGFDGFVDFEQVLCYAENNSKMQSQYDSGDGITPNVSGQEVMGKAANEMLLKALAEQSQEK